MALYVSANGYQGNNYVRLFPLLSWTAPLNHMTINLLLICYVHAEYVLDYIIMNYLCSEGT